MFEGGHGGGMPGPHIGTSAGLFGKKHTAEDRQEIPNLLICQNRVSFLLKIIRKLVE